MTRSASRIAVASMLAAAVALGVVPATPAQNILRDWKFTLRTWGGPGGERSVTVTSEGAVTAVQEAGASAGSKRRKSKANARLSTDATERIFDLAMISLEEEIPRCRTESVEGVNLSLTVRRGGHETSRSCWGLIGPTSAGPATAALIEMLDGVLPDAHRVE